MLKGHDLIGYAVNAMGGNKISMTYMRCDK